MRLLVWLMPLLLRTSGPWLASRKSEGRVGFVLNHRRKMRRQDRWLLADAQAWARGAGMATPALDALLSTDRAVGPSLRVE